MHQVHGLRVFAIGSMLVLAGAACSTDDNSTSDSVPNSAEAATTPATDVTALDDTTAGTTESTSSDTTATTVAPTAPAGLASQVLAPAGVTYVGETSIESTGYWTSYSVDPGGDLDLDDYASLLETLGWTIDDSSDSSITATMSGGWLDVLVVEADTGDTLSVCVWNASPDADACKDFPATLLETSAPPTT
jgi:hypothetical protein